MKGTRKQKSALSKLVDKVTRIVLYGGAAGGGKSFLGCFWLLLMCKAYPNTRWFIGRQELKRIRQSTLITWYKVCALVGFDGFTVNHKDNFIQLDNGSRIDMLDMEYKPSDPMYERFGSIEYTGGWIEEGGEINFGAYDTIKTRIGRHLNVEYGLMPKLLITCNPKKNWLYTYFYKPFKAGNLSNEVVFIQALVTDNPNLDPNYLDNLNNIQDKAKRERLLYGNWEYDDDPAQLITYEAATDYFTNSFIKPDGYKYITADIARKGRDKTIIRVWHGWAVIERIEMAVSKVNESVDLIKEVSIKHQVPMSRVIADEDGVGGGVVDYLQCNGFVNNSRALKGEQGEVENYTNLKSQCSFGIAKMIMDRLLFENCRNEQVKSDTIEEMEQVRQLDIEKDGKVGLVPKDKIKENIGRSPDEWDSIMMRYWFVLAQTELVILM